MVDVKKTVELIANIAIVVVAGLLCWTVASNRHPQKDLAIAAAEASLVGKSLNPPPGYNWQGNNETLVLAIKSTCHFCEESMPFYRQLSAMQSNNTLKAHLLAVMPDQREAGSRFLQSSALPVDAIFGQQLDSIHVNGTPTLLLMDSHGQVIHAWIGELPPEDQNSVIAAVRM